MGAARSDLTVRNDSQLEALDPNRPSVRNLPENPTISTVEKSNESGCAGKLKKPRQPTSRAERSSGLGMVFESGNLDHCSCTSAIQVPYNSIIEPKTLSMIRWNMPLAWTR